MGIRTRKVSELTTAELRRAGEIINESIRAANIPQAEWDEPWAVAVRAGIAGALFNQALGQAK